MRSVRLTSVLIMMLIASTAVLFGPLSSLAQIQPTMQTEKRLTQECKGAIVDQASIPGLLRVRLSEIDRAVWRWLCDRRPLKKADWNNKSEWEKLFSGTADQKWFGKNWPIPAHLVSAELIKAVVISNRFDGPVFDFVDIEDVVIENNMDLAHEILRSSLILRDCTFKSDVNLNFFRVIMTSISLALPSAVSSMGSLCT